MEKRAVLFNLSYQQLYDQFDKFTKNILGTAKRTEECAGYNGKEMTAPSMEQMNKEIVEHVVKKTLSEIKLKNGKPALSLYGEHTHLHINPSGKSHGVC